MVVKGLFLLPSTWVSSLLIFGSGAFKMVLLDLGWGPGYPRCHGQLCTNTIKKYEAIATENINKNGKDFVLCLCLNYLALSSFCCLVAMECSRCVGFGQKVKLSMVSRTACIVLIGKAKNEHRKNQGIVKSENRDIGVVCRINTKLWCYPQNYENLHTVFIICLA